MTRSIITRVSPILTRVSIVDIVLVAVAVAFAAITLAFPFGRDQGLYYYVGREWLHGSVPYRDLMEQKPPLIYLIYAIAMIQFGEHLWSIRLLELIFVVGVSQILGSLAAPRGQSPIRGTRGAATVASVVLYWGFLSYWETAQCEIWYSGTCFASLWVGRQITRRPLAWWLAGGCAGLALLIKPPAAAVLVVVVAFFVFQLLYENAERLTRWREIGRFVLHFSLGAAVPIAITIGYFWAAGALPDAVDVLIRANGHYLLYERTSRSVWYYWIFALYYCWPFSFWIPFLPFVGLVFAWRARSLELAVRYVLAGSLFIAAIATIVLQAKFYGYHWGTMVFPGAYIVACSVNDLARWFSSKWTAYGITRVPAVVAAYVTLCVYFAYAPLSSVYSREIATTLRFWAGSIDQEAFDRQFDRFESPAYWWGENRQVGLWLKEHSRPGDLLAVRGFEPAIYAISGRRAPTRFFWTAWLTDRHRMYKRMQWAREDIDALRRSHPRYLVIVRGAKRGAASARFAASFGYVHERFGTAHFRVMARFSHGRSVRKE